MDGAFPERSKNWPDGRGKGGSNRDAQSVRDGTGKIGRGFAEKEWLGGVEGYPCWVGCI